MSEFKYACPVCGQHIKCESSQAGTQMECPTCFQKIAVPQAPATDDQKFIITGTKVGERPAPTIQEDRVVVAMEKRIPVAALVALLVLAGAAGAAVYVFRGQIFKSSKSAAPTNEAASGQVEIYTRPATNPPRPKPPPPAPLVAPPANDTNWMLNLEAAVIPDSTVAGRIHGNDFICERAYVESGALVLRAGTRGPALFAITINFGATQPESLAGQSVNVTTNVPKAAIVTLRWTGDDAKTLKENFTNGYALRLDFNKLASNHVSGRIYFCAPDDLKSYVAGAFNANIRRPRPQPQ